MAIKNPLCNYGGDIRELASGDSLPNIPESAVINLTTDLAAKEATANKDASGGYAGLTSLKINFKNVANTFISFFTNSNTAARTYTFQDRNGTIADDTDITAAKARANHTGTQLAATVSDFNSAALAAAPAETTTTEGAIINGATSKATPVDADYLGLMDSAASNILKKLSWANLKATAKTYFDTLYVLQTSKDATGGYAGLTLFKINFKNAANTFTSFFTNTNTAARTYTFQDRNGTVADDTDITNAKARGNHTGTQLAATVSDFNSAVLATCIKAKLTASAAQSIANVSLVTVNFDQHPVLNSGYTHSTITNNSRLYVDAAGTYLFILNGGFAPNAGGSVRSFQLQVNGATVFAIQQSPQIASASYNTIANVCGQIALSANDYVEVILYQDSGGALNTINATYGMILTALKVG